jgi:membrane protease YdiL (CAAX protease family)
MRETLANSATLLRYGWHAAWGALLIKQPSITLRTLLILSVSYLPLLYFYQSYRALDLLADRASLNRLFTEWQLPPAALLEPSTLWAGVPQLIGMGLAVIFLTMFVGGIFAVYLMSQRKGNDTDLEWLRTFPIPLRSVLWGRLLQSTVIQPYFVLIILPFLLTFVIVRGHNLVFSLLTATLLAWMGMLAAASLGLLLHNLTTVHLTPARQRDLRALAVLLSMAAFFLIYFPFIMNEGLYWRTILKIAPSIQSSGLLQGMTSLLSGDAASVPPLLFALGAVLALAQGSVIISEKIVSQGSSVQERAGRKEGRFLGSLLDMFSPIMRREIRLLMRDRSQWVSMISGPLFGLGFMIWDSLGDQSNLQGKSLLFMCLIMYLMLTGLSVSVLFHRERPSLWFYSAMPLRLSDTLREQLKVPRILFGLFFGVAFLVFVPHSFWQDAESLLRLALGLYFAFITGRHYRSLTLLAYTPGTENPVTKPFLFMIWICLTPAFAVLVFAGNAWNVAAFLIPYTALVFTHEKKVLALEDYLIDPSYPISQRADLAQGFLAAMIYTFALVTGNTLAFFFDLNFSVQFLIAALTLWAFHFHFISRNVQDGPVYFGALRFLDFLFLGLGCAFILRAAGLWDRLIHDAAFLEHIYDLRFEPAVPATAVLLFVLIARSVTEELIFRGLIQRGLSSRLGWPLAVITSAGLTTLCHSPQDFGPILLTSLGAGLLYQRTRILWPGIVLAMAVHSLRLFGF